MSAFPVPTTLRSTCVGVGCQGVMGAGMGRAILSQRVLNEIGIAVEELELSVLVGHGYKWMAAASTVIYR